MNADKKGHVFINYISTQYVKTFGFPFLDHKKTKKTNENTNHNTKTHTRVINKTLHDLFLFIRDCHVEGRPTPTINKRTILGTTIIIGPKAVFNIERADKHVIKIKRVNLCGCVNNVI